MKTERAINPLKDENAGKPYSPKMTCGACHDYEKITKGFHFTQGVGEKPTAEQAAPLPLGVDAGQLRRKLVFARPHSTATCRRRRTSPPSRWT